MGILNVGKMNTVKKSVFERIYYGFLEQEEENKKCR